MRSTERENRILSDQIIRDRLEVVGAKEEVAGLREELEREKQYRLDDEKKLARMDDIEEERDIYKAGVKELEAKLSTLEMDTCLKRYRLLQAEHARLAGTLEQLRSEMRAIRDYLNDTCVCGARGESLDTHPHAPACRPGVAADRLDRAVKEGGSHGTPVADPAGRREAPRSSAEPADTSTSSG